MCCEPLLGGGALGGGCSAPGGGTLGRGGGNMGAYGGNPVGGNCIKP